MVTKRASLRDTYVMPKGTAGTEQGTATANASGSDAGGAGISGASDGAQSAEPRDLKTMMCRVNRAGWSEMSKLAIDRDMNLEDMLIEACNELLRHHSRPPVIEKRSPNARKPAS